jgi:hypothetical protein
MKNPIEGDAEARVEMLRAELSKPLDFTSWAQLHGLRFDLSPMDVKLIGAIPESIYAAGSPMLIADWARCASEVEGSPVWPQFASFCYVVAAFSIGMESHNMLLPRISKSIRQIITFEELVGAYHAENRNRASR